MAARFKLILIAPDDEVLDTFFISDGESSEGVYDFNSEGEALVLREDVLHELEKWTQRAAQA